MSKKNPKLMAGKKEEEPNLWAWDANAKMATGATIASVLMLWWMAVGCPGCLS